MVGRRMSPGGRDMRPMPPRDGHHMGPVPRDSRPMPHAPPPDRDGLYPPVYQTPSRPKRDYPKPSPDMRRPRSRSISPPPPKKRHPPPPADGYGRGGTPPPPMRRRRSYTPPPPQQMRRHRSRSRTPPPPRKQRAASPPPPPPPPPPRGSRGGSAPRSSHGHRSGGAGGEGRERPEPSRSQRAAPAEPSADGQPSEFYGPWGTRITRNDLKKITVDIKRTVPKNKRSSSPIIRRIINADDITLHRRTGEGSRPLWDRAELQTAVNRRFDDGPPPPPEPRVVAIIREPGHGNAGGSRREPSPYEQRPRERERGYPPQQAAHSVVPVGDRIDRERSERNQRQVAKLEQMEVAIDRKLEQIQRYEQKYEETLRDEKYGEPKDDRKQQLMDRNVRDRLGSRRDRPRSMSPPPKQRPHEPRDRGYPEGRDTLPDFSQRPDKPPIWGEEDGHGRDDYYQHDGRSNGYRGRGRGRPGGFRGIRGRGFRGGPRGRGGPSPRGGRFSPASWQHDKYEVYN